MIAHLKLLFFSKSVDAILGTFHLMIAKLEAAGQRLMDDIEHHGAMEQKARDLKAAAQAELAKAQAAATKIKALLTA